MGKKSLKHPAESELVRFCSGKLRMDFKICPLEDDHVKMLSQVQAEKVLATGYIQKNSMFQGLMDSLNTQSSLKQLEIVVGNLPQFKSLKDYLGSSSSLETIDVILIYGEYLYQKRR
jgi:hypothetical protein